MPNGHVMPIAIVAAAVAAKPPTALAPPPKAPPPSGAAAAGGSKSHQQAAISQMLVKYAYEQSRGANTMTLSALGKQITAAAKALGQHVTLPQAPAGKFNVTA
jgi:hypothetical protein